jgi:hypothetical protein
MYHEHPADERAYDVPNQFTFGSELVVAPVTTPRDPVTLRGSVRAWLPPGVWIDVFTGVVYRGDRFAELHRDLASVPALLRGGGILPLGPDSGDAAANPERIELLVAPGADGAFTLVEDDAEMRVARTRLTWHQETGELVIGAAEDPHGVLPRRRTWTVTFLGLDRSITVEDAPVDEPLTVGAGASDPQPRTKDLRGALFALLTAAQYGHEAKATAWATVTSGLPVAAMLAELHAQGLPRSLAGALGELLTAEA